MFWKDQLPCTNAGCQTFESQKMFYIVNSSIQPRWLNNRTSRKACCPRHDVETCAGARKEMIETHNLNQLTCIRRKDTGRFGSGFDDDLQCLYEVSYHLSQVFLWLYILYFARPCTCRFTSSTIRQSFGPSVGFAPALNAWKAFDAVRKTAVQDKVEPLDTLRKPSILVPLWGLGSYIERE